MLNVVIEEYVEKKRAGFYMPAIPWKWTVYQGSKIMTYGYTHTKKQAEEAANGALSGYELSGYYHEVNCACTLCMP
jgi:hypothetical protein